MPPSVTPNYIDIFAGAGGISLGLFKSGWKGLFAIEKSDMAFDTLKHNLIDKKGHFEWPDWLPITSFDISDILEEYRHQLQSLSGRVDLVVGGPPCQGFSFAGLRKYNDERNLLIHSYLDFIEMIKPKILFLENVVGFNSGHLFNEKRERAYSEYMLEHLISLGYESDHRTINFSEFGVPQSRKRFILVGFRDNNPAEFFSRLYDSRSRFLNENKLKPKTSCWEAISDLEMRHGTLQPINSQFKFGVYGRCKSQYQMYLKQDWNRGYPDSHRFTNHSERIINRSKDILVHCKRNTNIDNTIKQRYNIKKHSIIPLDAEAPSPTLTTLPDDYIHYSEPRILTVREYARIQSFPDWYEIRNKYTTGGKARRVEIPRYTQVGNAVPPLFAEQVGLILKEMLYV